MFDNPQVAKAGSFHYPYFFHVIARRPLIVYSCDYGTVEQLLFDLRIKPLWLLVACSWCMRSPEKIERALVLQRWCEKHPHHHVLFLGNDHVDMTELRRHGIRARLCSRSCFLDEAIFTIQPEVSKRYRAVYDARLTPFKRHELAADVDNLALITYINSGDMNCAYPEHTRQTLSQAIWINGPFSQRNVFLCAEEVAATLNASHVGLALSASEGASLASAQYLLCGLPVVSTPSDGGREDLYNPDYALLVPPDRAAVAEGVTHMINDAPPSREIRAAVLDWMRPHRLRFLDLIEEIYSIEKCPFKRASAWESFFQDKLARPKSRRDAEHLLCEQ